MKSRLGIWQIAARLASGGSRVALVVVAEGKDVGDLAVQLRDDLASLLETTVKLSAALTAADVEQAFQQRQSTVFFGLELLGPFAWKKLDVARSRLRARCIVALVVTEATAKLIATAAPNLASWLAGGTYAAVAGGDVQHNRFQLLEGLRGHFGMDDDEAIRRATLGTRPSHEPEFAVWLILLGRSDLVSTGTE